MAELRAELMQFDSGPPDTLAEGTSAATTSLHALSGTGARVHAQPCRFELSTPPKPRQCGANPMVQRARLLGAAGSTRWHGFVPRARCDTLSLVGNGGNQV